MVNGIDMFNVLRQNKMPSLPPLPPPSPAPAHEMQQPQRKVLSVLPKIYVTHATALGTVVNISYIIVAVAAASATQPERIFLVCMHI